MTLPQNVKDVVKLMDGCISTLPEGNKRDWQAIRAHLLSQDAEIADLIGKRDFLLRHYNLAESRLAAANERLEAAERDSKRLDWLESQREAYGFENCHEGNRWVIDGPFATVRRAIDATQEGE